MNDYTKNISQSIFTPGIYNANQNAEKLLRSFAERRGVDPDGGWTSTINTDSYKNLFHKQVTGTTGKFSGKLGEKYVSFEKKPRVRSAAPTQSRNLGLRKNSQPKNVGDKGEADSQISGARVYYDQHRLKNMR